MDFDTRQHRLIYCGSFAIRNGTERMIPLCGGQSEERGGGPQKAIYKNWGREDERACDDGVLSGAQAICVEGYCWVRECCGRPVDEAAKRSRASTVAGAARRLATMGGRAWTRGCGLDGKRQESTERSTQTSAKAANRGRQRGLPETNQTQR